MLMLVAMEGGVMVVRLFVPPPGPRWAPGPELCLRHKLPRDIRDTEARVTICDTDEIVAMYIHELSPTAGQGPSAPGKYVSVLIIQRHVKYHPFLSVPRKNAAS